MLLQNLFSRKEKKCKSVGSLTVEECDSVKVRCSRCQANLQRRSLLAAMIGFAARWRGATPLLASLLHTTRAEAAGKTLSYDLSKLPLGQAEMLEWQGKPVWVIHRTPKMVADLKKNTPDLEDPKSVHSVQPDYAAGETRSIRPEYFVCIGMCTHMGCALTPKLKRGAGSGMGEDWNGGFLCPCHGSRFDLAGRVYKSMPALLNLEIPPYTHLDDTHLIIGQNFAKP